MACSSYALKPISPSINLVNPRSHPTSSPANNTQLSFKLSNPSRSQTLKFHSTSPQSPSFSLPKRSFTCKSQADPSDSTRPSKYFSHLLTHPPIFTPQNYTFGLDPMSMFSFSICFYSQLGSPPFIFYLWLCIYVICIVRFSV